MQSTDMHTMSLFPRKILRLPDLRVAASARPRTFSFTGRGICSTTTSVPGHTWNQDQTVNPGCFTNHWVAQDRLGPFKGFFLPCGEFLLDQQLEYLRPWGDRGIRGFFVFFFCQEQLQFREAVPVASQTAKLPFAAKSAYLGWRGNLQNQHKSTPL